MVTLNKFQPQVIFRTDASGAWQAGKNNDVVVIVDIIDMSTTLECALEAGALAVFGASTDHCKFNIPLGPEVIGYKAGRLGIENQSSIVIVTEPRWGKKIDLINSCSKTLKGIEKTGAVIKDIIPNLGTASAKMCDFKNKVVIAVTDCGGVAYDAAYTAGGTVLTGTIARTLNQKGTKPALSAVNRSLELAIKLKKNISVVAASANSFEDVLAAQYIVQKLLERIRCC
ncbi:hypothetical protein RDV78_06350 [Bacillota bacterium LX-D]|nr:hypothetical protein [Bacillota bacterium LX-D]